jgi:hypothetical protein
VHLAFEEGAGFAETYGFAGNQGKVNVEGIRIFPRGVASDTLLVFMHPASTLQLLHVPRAAVMRGAHVLCAGSRYARNDSACIMEKVLLDLGAYIRHAKTVWGYRHVVLVGWSGGGSLALFYQGQAERPSITHSPAGDPIDIRNAGLIPADAVILQAAHSSRARLLAEIIDPSVRNELDPDDRDASLDIYDPANPTRPPYPPDFIARYRAAQLDRMRRITAWTKDMLETLRRKGGAELERGFVVHRTMADPRFLDGTLDPNGRRIGWCSMGNPETEVDGAPPYAASARRVIAASNSRPSFVSNIDCPKRTVWLREADGRLSGGMYGKQTRSGSAFRSPADTVAAPALWLIAKAV